ncbi:hypothetical protein KAU11_03460 [Candidatus Babeliales bacterium]|nr:hypothetical protein [Candidatus Babeliales bacterium]
MNYKKQNKKLKHEIKVLISDGKIVLDCYKKSAAELAGIKSRYKNAMVELELKELALKVSAAQFRSVVREKDLNAKDLNGAGNALKYKEIGENGNSEFIAKVLANVQKN